MLEILYGNEPYLIDCHINKAISRLTLPDINYYVSEIADDVFFEFLRTAPVMDDTKIAVLKVISLKELNNISFGTIPDNCIVYVVPGEVDARCKFFKEHKSIAYEKLSYAELERFVVRFVSSSGCRFLEGAKEVFLKRENYADMPDVTLFTILGDLKNLLGVSECISKETVEKLVPQRTKDNAFAIASLIAKNDLNGLLEQAKLLGGMEIPTLGALLREYRLAYKALYFQPSSIGVSKITFSYLPGKRIVQAMEYLTNLIEGLKQSKVPKDCSLTMAFTFLVSLNGGESYE